MGLLAVIAAGLLAAGLGEARAHRRALGAVPLRVHVNGTRGKSSVTKAIAALFRELGKKAVGKTTGTLPVVIEPDGTERRIGRRGRTRVQEQVRILRYAAAAGADAAVLECMAVDPVLQWVCEHVFVRSHIGVITNVRRDHFEEMGRDLEEIARSLANTVPRNGVLVTADARFAPLFAEVAAQRGTKVVVVGEDEVARAFRLLRGEASARHEPAGAEPPGEGGWNGQVGQVVARLEDELLKMHAENVAVACKVVELAGFPEAAVWDAARKLPRPRLHVTDLSLRWRAPSGRVGAAAGGERGVVQGRECLLVHAWSMNDTDSFRRLLALAGDGQAGDGREGEGQAGEGQAGDGQAGDGRAGDGWADVVVLYNHRSDRPLRALDFGQLFAAETAVRGVLVTGDAGGGRLLRRAGVPAEKLRTLRLPLTVDAVADAVADVLSRAAIGAEAGAPGDGAGGAAIGAEVGAPGERASGAARGAEAGAPGQAVGGAPGEAAGGATDKAMDGASGTVAGKNVGSGRSAEGAAGGGGSGDDGNPAEPAERPRPIIVFGCGNARGVEALELGGQLPAEIRTDQD